MVVPLARTFAQQPPLASIRPILQVKESLEDQQSIVNALGSVNDARYVIEVLKFFINMLEQKGLEVDAEIWELYYGLRSSKLDLASELSSVKYDLPGNRFVEIKEKRQLLVADGETGHRTWESSLALTEYICTNLAEFEDVDQVIELGAGTGLVSLALAKLGLSQHIIASDGSGPVLSKLEETVSANQSENLVQVKHVDWTDPLSLEPLPENALVVAGDILYGLTTTYPQIIAALQLLKPKRVLFCNPIRNEESYETFKKLCADQRIVARSLKTFRAESAEESEYMFIVSIPPIRLELLELVMP